MKHTIQLLDVVALTVDLPQQGLRIGQVGTVVEILADGVFEIEFLNEDGATEVMAAVPAGNLLVLQYTSSKVA